MTRLAEDARGRPDQDESAVTVELPQKPARSEEARRQVRVERRAPALERELPDGYVSRRPHTGDCRADVEAPAFGEQPLDFLLLRQVGTERHRRVEGLCPLPTPMVMRHALRALRHEGTGARAADASGRAGDENALAAEPGVHVW